MALSNIFAEIEVTTEMIQAGREATRPEDDCPPDELMARIYRAMERVRRVQHEAAMRRIFGEDDDR